MRVITITAAHIAAGKPLRSSGCWACRWLKLRQCAVHST